MQDDEHSERCFAAFVITVIVVPKHLARISVYTAAPVARGTPASSQLVAAYLLQQSKSAI